MSLARNLQVIGEGFGGDMDRPTDIELRLLANKRSELVYMPLLLKTLESSIHVLTDFQFVTNRNFVLIHHK